MAIDATRHDQMYIKSTLMIAMLVLAMIALGACTMPGSLVVPEQDGVPILSETDKKIAEGYARLRAARRTINTLERDKIITNAQMRSFHVEADKVRMGLDAALSADIDVDRGAHLESAMVLLRLLRAELVKRQVKG